jgi:hypothetical protein
MTIYDFNVTIAGKQVSVSDMLGVKTVEKEEVRR